MSKVKVLSFLFVFLSLIILPVFVIADKGAPGFWSDDLNKALDASKKNGKMIVVQLYSETCPYCSKMDREVLNQDSIKELCQKEINCVRISGATNTDGQNLVQKFRIPGFPVTLFVDADGMLIDRIYGYVPLERYVAGIQDVIKRNDRFNESLETVKKDKNNIEANYYAAEGFYERKNFEDSLKYVDVVLKNDPKGTNPLTTKAYMLKGMIILVSQQDYVKSLEFFEIVINKWPASNEAKNSLYLKAMILIEKGETKQGKDILLQIKKKYPNDGALISRIDKMLSRLG
ncbi:MAG: thioredoxin fold domain-containing protein [Acidobacteria bacterium]|nr:thioredoxin fold domain-containing protein [Acidobacteriota bacterium]